MLRILLIMAAAGVAALPAVFGLMGNSSLTTQVPAVVPSGAVVVQRTPTDQVDDHLDESPMEQNWSRTPHDLGTSSGMEECLESDGEELESEAAGCPAPTVSIGPTSPAGAPATSRRTPETPETPETPDTPGGDD